jgi:hypothetical protein
VPYPNLGPDLSGDECPATVVLYKELEGVLMSLRGNPSGVSVACREDMRLSEDVEMAVGFVVRVECEATRRQTLLLRRNVDTGVGRGSGSESCPSRNADKPITKLVSCRGRVSFAGQLGASKTGCGRWMRIQKSQVCMCLLCTG